MFTELYREEKRRGRKATEVARRIKREIKRRVTYPASNHFLMCTPQSGPLRDVHRVIQRREEKRKEGDRGGQEDKGGNQTDRDRSSQ